LDLGKLGRHSRTLLLREGGDATGADVVVVAVPGEAIAEALSKVQGLAGEIAVDTSNSFSGPRDGFSSLAAEVKSIIGGPTAKSFSTNFAKIYDQFAAEQRRPSNVFAAEPEAREVTEQLIRDAGFEPVYAGDLDSARTIENHITYSTMLTDPKSVRISTDSHDPASCSRCARPCAARARIRSTAWARA
jgi:8-hydroxy-5-deazaflavin:NADPH oxidoreductase